MLHDMGARLSAARRYVGLSQDFVANAIGVPRSALSDMERNQRRVSADEARALAELYGCSLDHLVSGTSAPAADASIQALARVTSGLTDDDIAEVARFAEFLRSRPKPRSLS
jgi:transcriptional regulator with XRE-family HTH domain